MNLMPYDELNTFKAMVTEYKTEPLTNDEKARLRLDIEDYIEFLLIEAYVYGNVQAMQDLGLLDLDPKDLVDEDEMRRVINEKIADKTYKQRIEEYLDAEDSTVEDFQRVAETDATRVYNAGVVDGGKASGVQGVMKQWVTMEDEKVRSTHEYLANMIVPLEEDFYTYDGDHARAPGLFSDPANSINCRCTLTLIRE
jgi:hypothetical protein